MGVPSEKSRLWKVYTTERGVNLDSPLISERRIPENATIRRWFDLADKALESDFPDDDLEPAV